MNYIENKIEEKDGSVKVTVVPVKKSLINRYTFTVGMFIVGFVLVATGMAVGLGSCLSIGAVFLAKKFHDVERQSWK